MEPPVPGKRICCELISWNYVYRLASRLAHEHLNVSENVKNFDQMQSIVDHLL